MDEILSRFFEQITRRGHNGAMPIWQCRRTQGGAAYYELGSSSLSSLCSAITGENPAKRADAELVLDEIVVSEADLLRFCRSLRVRPPEYLLARQNRLEWLDAQLMAPPVVASEPASARPVARRGYHEADQHFVKEALRLCRADPELSPWAAVQALGEDLPGVGTLVSKQRRIHRKVKNHLDSSSGVRTST
jgi:hypothetical protein